MIRGGVMGVALLTSIGSTTSLTTHSISKRERIGSVKSTYNKTKWRITMYTVYYRDEWE